MEFLQIQIASNTLQAWFFAAVITVAVLLLAGLIQFISIKQLNRLDKRNEVPLWPILLAVVRRTKWLFLFVLAL